MTKKSMIGKLGAVLAVCLIASAGLYALTDENTEGSYPTTYITSINITFKNVTAAGEAAGFSLKLYERDRNNGNLNVSGTQTISLDTQTLYILPNFLTVYAQTGSSGNTPEVRVRITVSVNGNVWINDHIELLNWGGSTAKLWYADTGLYSMSNRPNLYPGDTITVSVTMETWG